MSCSSVGVKAKPKATASSDCDRLGRGAVPWEEGWHCRAIDLRTLTGVGGGGERGFPRKAREGEEEGEKERKQFGERFDHQATVGKSSRAPFFGFKIVYGFKIVH